MEIKISISDGVAADVQYTQSGARSPEMPVASAQTQPAPGQAAASAATDSEAAFSGGLNAGAAPAELAAPGAEGAPAPFIAAIDEGAQANVATDSDDLSAGAAPNR